MSRAAPKASPAATLAGVGAIALWSTLATLTALKGPAVPPFQTTAITFALAGVLGLLLAAARGRLSALRPTPASFALGVYGFFVYHALYFAALALAPPAEASLVASLWALFTVLFSALLPGHRLAVRHVAGALVGLAAAVLLTWEKLGAGAGAAGSGAPLGFLCAALCALVWSSYSVATRLVAALPSESLALPCLATAALALAASLALETWVWPPDVLSWFALLALGLGPVGIAFFLWDHGMKHGNVAQLGVLAYASPVLSTALLVAVGRASARWELALACLMMVAAAVIATRTSEG